MDIPESGPIGIATDAFPNGSSGAASTDAFTTWREDCRNDATQFLWTCISLAVLSVLVSIGAMIHRISLKPKVQDLPKGRRTMAAS